LGPVSSFQLKEFTDITGLRRYKLLDGTPVDGPSIDNLTAYDKAYPGWYIREQSSGGDDSGDQGGSGGTDPGSDVTPDPVTPPSQVNNVFTVNGSKVKVLSDATETTAGTVAFTKAKNSRSVTVPSAMTISGNSYKVTQINANAFKGSKIRTVTIGKNVKTIKSSAFKGSKATKLIVKTKLLKKTKVKGCLKGSKIKTVQVKVGKKAENKKYVKAYKKIFTKKNAGRKVTVK